MRGSCARGVGAVLPNPHTRNLASKKKRAPLIPSPSPSLSSLQPPQYKDLVDGSGDAAVPGDAVTVDWDGYTIGERE